MWRAENTRQAPAPIGTGGAWSSIEESSTPLSALLPPTTGTFQPPRQRFIREAAPSVVVPAHSSRLVRTLPTPDTIETDYDPTRPSYAQPIRRADEASTTPVVRHEEVGESYRAYPDVFPAVPYKQPAQDNLIVNPVPIYISLDSRDRDRAVWPQTNQYRVPLVTSSTNPSVKSTGDRIRNIYSISLLSCVVPNAPDVFDQPYLLLQIDEVEGIYDSANAPTTKAITKLYFRECFSGSKFLRLDKGVGDPTARVYWPAPKASLEQLTVSFRHYDGTLFDFGVDTVPPTDPNTELQTTLTLEVRTYVVDALDTIGHRNPN